MRKFFLSILTVLLLISLPNTTFANDSEFVYLAEINDSEAQALIVRENGDVYSIEYGVGVISIWRYVGESVVINSPGLFAGVGSTIVLPDDEQEAKIWNSEYVGNIYSMTQSSSQMPKDFSTQGIESNTTAITVTINNIPLVFSEEPVINSGRVMVPYRTIGEAIGATVKWDKANNQVIVQNEENIVKLTIGERTAWINGKKQILDTAPIVKHGTTLVPLRFLAESLKADVKWDQVTMTVSIWYRY